MAFTRYGIVATLSSSPTANTHNYSHRTAIMELFMETKPTRPLYPAEAIKERDDTIAALHGEIKRLRGELRGLADACREQEQIARNEDRMHSAAWLHDKANGIERKVYPV